MNAAVNWVRTVTGAVTPLGWFVLALTVIGWVVAARAHLSEAWFVALAGTVLLVGAIPFLLTSRNYRTRIQLARSSVIAGAVAQMQVEVHNDTASAQLPTLIELPVGDALRVLTVPLLPARKRVRLNTQVATTRRGVLKVGPLTVARQDPIGLLRRESVFLDTQTLYVHPKTVQLPPNTAGLVRDLEGQESQRVVESDLSFHAVREYVPGDALRHVHWKSTAKTGTLMVRQYQETQTARTAVLFDANLAEYASDDEFELGVSAAASVSLQAVREGRERTVVSAWSPGKRRPRLDGLEELSSRTASELLNAWSELTPVDTELSLETLADNLAHTSRDLSIVVLISGSQPSLDRIRRAALGFGPQVHVMAIRAHLFSPPATHRVDNITITTIGALTDLPALMLRGAR